MDAVARAKRRRWADTVVLVMGAFVIAWAIWVYPNTGPDVNEGTLWGIHATGGALALASVFLALRSVWLARALLLIAGLVLVVGLFAAFPVIDAGAILTVALPGVIMLAMVPLIGPMPTPEDEGKRR